MKNNIDIIISCVDRFDYDEYLSKATTETVIPILEYSQKIGMLEMALRKYPDIPPLTAYVTFIQSNSVYMTPAKTPNSTEPCTTCGGGKVL